jgi:hypothetical protein
VILIIPKPIWSTTTTPGISEFKTNLVIKKYIRLTWCVSILDTDRPGVEYLSLGTWSLID